MALLKATLWGDHLDWLFRVGKSTVHPDFGGGTCPEGAVPTPVLAELCLCRGRLPWQGFCHVDCSCVPPDDIAAEGAVIAERTHLAAHQVGFFHVTDQVLHVGRVFTALPGASLGRYTFHEALQLAKLCLDVVIDQALNFLVPYFLDEKSVHKLVLLVKVILGLSVACEALFTAAAAVREVFLVGIEVNPKLGNLLELHCAQLAGEGYWLFLPFMQCRLQLAVFNKLVEEEVVLRSAKQNLRLVVLMVLGSMLEHLLVRRLRVVTISALNKVHVVFHAVLYQLMWCVN